MMYAYEIIQLEQYIARLTQSFRIYARVKLRTQNVQIAIKSISRNFARALFDDFRKPMIIYEKEFFFSKTPDRH